MGILHVNWPTNEGLVSRLTASRSSGPLYDLDLWVFRPHFSLSPPLSAFPGNFLLQNKNTNMGD